VTTTSGVSDYQALQVQFKRRLSQGIEGLASYTLARSRDNASADSNLVTTPTALDGVRIDYGASDFDVRHAATAAVTWNIPGASSPTIAGAVTRNWSVDGLLTARSATPFNIRARITSLQYRTFIRPDVVPDVSWWIDDSLAPGGRRLNVAAFAVPAAGRQGTLPRNALRGFPLCQVDLALRRTFPIPGRARLQAKIEAFNVLNHPNFANPSSMSLTSPTFGVSTTMLGQGLGSGGATGGFSPLYQIGGPRSMQLSLRVSF